MQKRKFQLSEPRINLSPVTKYNGLKVPVKRLKLVSDQNYNDGFNRNVDCDALLKNGIHLLTIHFAVTHHHKHGLECPVHLRLLFVEYNLTQDITFDQMDDMLEDISILNDITQE